MVFVNRPKSKRFFDLVTKRCDIPVLVSLFVLVKLFKLGILLLGTPQPTCQLPFGVVSWLAC